jgi:hypothetical protein
MLATASYGVSSTLVSVGAEAASATGSEGVLELCVPGIGVFFFVILSLIFGSHRTVAKQPAVNVTFVKGQGLSRAVNCG